MSILNLEQKLVFKYFSEISQIPRPSGLKKKFPPTLKILEKKEILKLTLTKQRMS